MLLQVTDDAGASATDTVIVTVNEATPQPQGVVAISGPSSVRRGNFASFTVTLTNTGNAMLSGVELSFSVSPSRRIKDSSPGARVSVGNVPPGGSVSQTWTGRAEKAGSATVTAEAFSAAVSIGTATQPFTVMP